MVDIRLAHYIEKEREKGFSDEKIINTLDSAGFTKEDIDESLAYIDNEQVDYQELDKESAEREELEQSANKAPVGYRPRNIWIIVCCILLIIISAFFILKLGPANIKFMKQPRVMDEHARQALFNSLVNKCAEENPLDDTCIALVKGDVSLCREDECETEYFMTKAGFEKDDSYCLALKDIRTRTACNALATTKDACDVLSGLNKEYCLAISSNPNMCRGKDAAECKEEWQFADALRNRDLAMCERLRDNDKKIRCKALITDDPVECADKIICEDEAYLDLAVMTGDDALCKKIKISDTRTRCDKTVDSFFR